MELEGQGSGRAELERSVAFLGVDDTFLEVSFVNLARILFAIRMEWNASSLFDFCGLEFVGEE